MEIKGIFFTWISILWVVSEWTSSSLKRTDARGRADIIGTYVIHIVDSRLAHCNLRHKSGHA